MASRASDLFSIDSMSLNNVNLLGHKEVDGRNVMTNFMLRLRA
jgi:hypothetical protein